MKGPRQAPSSHSTGRRNRRSCPLRFGRDGLRVGGQGSPPGLRGFRGSQRAMRLASATSQALGRRSAEITARRLPRYNGGQCRRSITPHRPVHSRSSTPLSATAHIATRALLHSHRAVPAGGTFSRAARFAGLRRPPRSALHLDPDEMPTVPHEDLGHTRDHAPLLALCTGRPHRRYRIGRRPPHARTMGRS